MKRLLLVLLLISSVGYSQVDTVRTTDTPNQGRMKINQSLNYLSTTLLGRPVDTTGWNGYRHPILVLQGDTVWVTKEGILVGADSLDILMLARPDSMGKFAKETQVFKAPMTPMATGVNSAALGKAGVFYGADETTLWYGSLAKDSNGVLVYGYCYGGTQVRYKTSIDNGKTWSDLVIVATAPTGHTYEQCSFGITPTGAWVFLAREDSSQEWYTGSDLVTKCLKINVLRSTDSGVTWTLTGH
jgi:hypothetical protein